MSNYRKPINEEKVTVADGMTVGLPMYAIAEQLKENKHEI